MTADRHQVKINRAPILTLWAAAVAERLGFKREEALTSVMIELGIRPGNPKWQYFRTGQPASPVGRVNE